MLSAFSSLINQALETDEEAQNRLRKMGARLIRIEIRPLPDMGWSIADGQLTWVEPPEHPDLTLRGHLAAFVRYILTDRADDGIEIEGESEFAQELRNFLTQLDIDWVELLARHAGDLPAQFLARTWSETARTAQGFADAVERNARDYLHEESELLPEAEALEQFLRKVDDLRDDVERMELRFNRLSR